MRSSKRAIEDIDQFLEKFELLPQPCTEQEVKANLHQLEDIPGDVVYFDGALLEMIADPTTRDEESEEIKARDEELKEKQLAVIRRYLPRLNPLQRTLLLCWLKGISEEELADKMHVPREKCSAMMLEAVINLREKIFSSPSKTIH